MKVLFLTQVLPYPPNSGPKVKTYHVLRYLAGQGHAITLASFIRPGDEPHVEHLRGVCTQVHAVPMRRSRWLDVQAGLRSLGSRTPFLVARDARAEMFSFVRQALCRERYDIIHADQLTMAQYIEPCDGVSTVFDAHNAVWAIVERAAQTSGPLPGALLRYEANRLRRYEGALCRRMDGVLVVSEVDRAHLLAAGADAERVSVIPIAIDSAGQTPVARAAGANGIVSISTLFYPPNADGVRWFLREVYPLVHSDVPAAPLAIIGARPPQDIAEAARRMPGLVAVPGYVGDVRPHLEQAAVMVVPVRAASGMRVRILEALAQGVPVVTTTTGAEGIDVRDGEQALIADTPHEFAGAVVRLLREPELGRRLAANGRRLVEERYDWRVVLPALEQVYYRLREGR